MQKKYRTHTCGELTTKQNGEPVILSGWVHSRRDHGGVIFIDLRDRYGLTQIAFDPTRNKSAWEVADKLSHESIICVVGNVAKRPDDMINKNMQTGEIEIDGIEVTVLSDSEIPPFDISNSEDVNEELRLKYRYLDLRVGKLKKNVEFRSKVIKFIRDWMFDKNFLEIETPILTASSPEGARDFLVPSRIHKGMFFALPQAPQQYKQLLMVGGVDRYFQIAPCMRDEDARADRSVGEFYQLDVETSFLTQDEFFDLMEPLFYDLVQKMTNKKMMFSKFPRIKYKDAMNLYGTDKPDLRFDMKIQDVTELLNKCDFKVFKDAKCIKVLKVENSVKSIGRNEIDETIIPLAKRYLAKGLAWMRVSENGLESSITKFFKQEELDAISKKLDVKIGDILFFVADTWSIACKSLGAVRNYCAEKLSLIDQNLMAFAWIVDFPMYELNEETNKIDFCHNPFSMPQGGMDALLNQEPLEIVAYQYDIVCNGYELSSGAVRNHKPEIMYKAFEIAGYNKSVVDEKFGHMIKAFLYGAPPHCGFAPGIERLIMLLAGEKNIREVTAFPKNGKGQDLVVGAPASVDEKQLKDLGIKLV